MDSEKMKMIRIYAGEFLATFIFLFAVCSTLLNTPSDNIPTIGPISAGFAAFSVVFCFGGHFNPAVTLGAMFSKKMNVVQGLIFIVLQIFASFAAVGLVNALFPKLIISDPLLVSPSKNITNTAAVIMEFFLTFILVLVIIRSAIGVQIKPKIHTLNSAHENKDASEIPSEDQSTFKNIARMEESISPIKDNIIETAKEYQSRVKVAETRKNHAPLVIGLTIAFLGTMGSSVSGGAFNPLRPTAPAFYNLDFKHIWIYWVGDCLGGIAAGLVHFYLFEENN